MSSVYQPKRKEYAKVKIVSSEDYKKNRSIYKYVGSVNRGLTNFITTKINGLCSFVDDTSALTKKSKNDITRFFSLRHNNNKQVAYLVVRK